jgi:hypothetical protein
LNFLAIKCEIIEELEKHRDEELTEQRDKRQKAAADEKVAATVTNVAEQAPVSIHNFIIVLCMI